MPELGAATSARNDVSETFEVRRRGLIVGPGSASNLRGRRLKWGARDRARIQAGRVGSVHLGQKRIIRIAPHSLICPGTWPGTRGAADCCGQFHSKPGGRGGAVTSTVKP